MGAFAQGALVEQVLSTATSAGTLTLTQASVTHQRLTGTTTHNVVLPDATTMKAGRRFRVANRSTGVVTVKLNDASILDTVQPDSEKDFYLFANGTSNGTWDVSIANDQQSPLKLMQDPSGAGTKLFIQSNLVKTEDGANRSTPPLDDLINTYAQTTIDFSTGAITGGTIQKTGTSQGATYSFTATTVGNYRRMIFVYSSSANAINTTVSSEAASVGALTNPGTLFASLDGTPIGYVDLRAVTTTTFKTANSTASIIENADIYRFASGSGGGSGSGGTDFKLQSIATNFATIKKGTIILDSGDNLYTYDGVNLNVDLTIQLKTQTNTLGVTAPAALTNYMLCLDLAFLPSTKLQYNSLTSAYGAGSGTSGMFVVLLGSDPSTLDLSRYIPLAVLRTDSSSNYATFQNLALRRHQSPAVNVSPLVYEQPDASIGSVGALTSAVYGALATSDFPTPANAHVYGLNSDSNDAHGTPINLTQNGTPGFNRIGFFGRENIINLNGTTQYLSTTNSTVFNPSNATSWSVGMWVRGQWHSKTSGDGRLVVIGGNTSTAALALMINIDFSSGKNIQILKSTAGSLGSSTINNMANFKSWADNEWHHIAISRTASAALSLYVDGQLAASASDTLENSSSNFLSTIGRDTNAATSFFPGDIQDFFMNNGDALTASQINGIYSKRFKLNALGQLAGGHVLGADSFQLASLSGKVSFWGLDSVTDGSVNAKHLTNVNSAGFAGLNIFGAASCLTLDGVNQHLKYTADTFFDRDSKTTPFYVGGWFAAKNWASGAGELFSKWEDSTSVRNYTVGISAGVLTVTYSPDGAASTSLSLPTASFVNGSWHHVLIAYTGDTIKIYLDGIVVALNAAAQIETNTASKLAIGCMRPQGAAASFFAGRVDKFLFAKNIVATDSDIQKLVASTIPLSQSVPKLDQDWSAKFISEDGFVGSELADSWIVDKDDGKIWVNFGGASAARANIRLFDTGLGASTVPVRKFDKQFTATPATTLAHGLPSMPTVISILHNQLADGKYAQVAQDFVVKADSVNIYVDLSSLTISASADLRIIASVGVPAIGVGKVFKTITSAYTAKAGEKLMADSSGGAFTITLPATPAAFDEVEIFDATDSWATNNVTLARNGSNIEGTAVNFTANAAGDKIRLVYFNTAQGWRIY